MVLAFPCVRAIVARLSGFLWRATTLTLALAFATLSGCRSANTLPKPGSERYLHFDSSFYVGLAGLQVGDDVRAEASLAEAAALAPGEPAVWVNWGVLALRQRNYDAALTRLDRAHTLAPKNSQVDYLLGLLESGRGNSGAAIGHLQDAVAEDSRNLRALYQLAAEVERQGEPGSDQQFEKLMQQVLAIAPGNLAAQLELCRVAAKLGDEAALRGAVGTLAAHGKTWPADVTQQMTQLQAAAQSSQPRTAATRGGVPPQRADACAGVPR